MKFFSAYHSITYRMKPKKTRTKIFVTLMLVSLPPLFILGYFSYDIAKNRLYAYNTESNEIQLATSSEVADMHFRNIVSLHRYVVYNHAVRDELSGIALGTVESDSESLERRNRLVNLLSQIIHENSVDIRYVSSMCVMDMNYTAYCFGKNDDAGIYETTGKKEQIEESAWYQDVSNARGRVLFFSNDVLGDQENSFSSVKLFRDSSNIDGEVLGLLIINISKNMFQTVFNSENESGHFMAVDFDRKPPILIYADRTGQFPVLDYSDRKQLEASLVEQNYLVSDFKNSMTKWSFMHIIERNELLQDSKKIGTYTTLIASIIAILALVVSYIISGTITKPLLKLKKMMMDWKQGIAAADSTFQDDEIGSLGKTFSTMVKENESLNIKLYQSKLKEREAELKALQAQIKPHFLYNTLDSIYLMARMKKTDEVAQMALSLSESFKLSLNKGKETIPIFKELQHIEHYMTIQNIRYNHRFSCEVKVDKEIMAFEILKLILQPLVENAIYHGLEPKIGTGNIWIEGKLIGQELYFKIKDDGVGMEDVGATERGYGINNVRERVKLYYGHSARFIINSQKDKGTTIELYFTPFPIEEDA